MAAHRQHKLLQAGARAPDFRLHRLDGGEAAIRELIAASPALLAFFKVTCPVCQFTLPMLDRIHTPGRLPIYGISQNDAADTREFNGEFAVRFPTLLDSEEDGFPVSNAFGISSVPTMFLIEPDGTVSRVLEGWNKQEIAWLGDRAGASTRSGPAKMFRRGKPAEAPATRLPAGVWASGYARGAQRR